MNTKEEKIVIGISDYDNRWNKVAVEIARAHLYPGNTVKQKTASASDQERREREPSKGLDG